MPIYKNGDTMSLRAYTALIRTFNSQRTLGSTLEALERQSVAPSTYVFVDSGSTDQTLALVPKDAIIHHYKEERFNYAESLNQGIAYIETPFSMVISSHTSLENDRALEYAMALLDENEEIAAAYFVQELGQNMRFERIDRSNFSGFNGAWNTCAVYKTHLLKKRFFRPEVFSAEDQEWSNWAINNENMCIAKIIGAGMSYKNPSGNSVSKSLNERLAVAIYVRNEMLGFRYLLRTLYRAMRPRSSVKERIINVALLYSLISHNLAAWRSRRSPKGSV
jgi:glycosyltransferase involved in cell wall biosynthesis